jgi:hypothetical protein
MMARMLMGCLQGKSSEEIIQDEVDRLNPDYELNRACEILGIDPPKREPEEREGE